MGTQIQRYRIEDTSTIDSCILNPLKEGKPVTLVVRDSRINKRKGADKLLLLLISPLSIYNIEGDGLLFSMPSYGSIILEIGKLKVTQLYKMGLSMKSASVLVLKLNELFKK